MGVADDLLDRGQIVKPLSRESQLLIDELSPR
jgi:hypothetical protein